MCAGVVVFLGPSLGLEEARALLAADYRPPIRTGDLDSIPGGSVVGIIDGVLEPAWIVQPDEIRRALRRGAEIYGSASTGALLVPRLSHPRFHGLGRVHEALRQFPDAAEDLVSILYAEHDTRPMTEPLINAVITFMDAAPLVARADHHSRRLRELVTALRAIPLPDRSRGKVAAALRAAGRASGVADDLEIRDHKAADARLLLRRLATLEP
jgi:hypothetical protein